MKRKKGSLLLTLLWAALMMGVFMHGPSDAAEIYWGGGTSNFNLYSGVLVKKSYEIKIGIGGNGIFSQEGGLFQFSGAMYLGDQATGRGTYNMRGGAIEAGLNGLGEIAIGEWGGRGEFYHSGGTITIGGLNLARQMNRTGQYSLEGDALLKVQGTARIGDRGNGAFTQTGGTFQTDEVWVGVAATGYGEYRLSGGDLKTTFLIIGGKDGVNEPGTGFFLQTGGNVETGGLWVGDTAGSNSTYSLSNDGNLWVASYDIIGMRGKGTFNHDGGTHTSSGNLELGGSPTAQGFYNLYSGALMTAGTIVGSWGYGEFNQYGGVHKINRALVDLQADFIVGANPGVTGRYRLSGGNLEVQATSNLSPWNHISYIGYNGMGIFDLDAGNHITGEMIIGYADTSSLGPSGAFGEYNLNSSASYLSAWQIVIGGKYSNGDLPGYGTLNQYDGIVETGHLWVSDTMGSQGVYNLYNGNLFVGGYNVIGSAGTGVFNQYGGWHYANGESIAIGTAGNGAYNLHAGALSTNNTFVGESLSGQFNQTGGSVTIGGGLFISYSSESGGGNPNPGNGAYIMDGGQLTAGTIHNYGLFKGNAAAGHLSVSGGFLNFGTVAPGQSPGTLTITGDYFQDPVGSLLIELGGMDQGISYDLLLVTGSATLGGSLKVSLWDGFAPADGSFFDILKAANISGEFDFGSSVMPGGWVWGIAYLDLDGMNGFDTVRLTANAVPLPNAAWLIISGLIGLAGVRRSHT